MPLTSSRAIATIVSSAWGAAQAMAIHHARPATPFSTGSEIATAVALSGVSAVVLDQHLGARRDRSAVLGRLPAPTPGRIGPGALVSLALLALIVGFELFSFFAGSRFDHPTLSSMETSADRWFAAKAAIAFVWLSLGWYLVRR